MVFDLSPLRLVGLAAGLIALTLAFLHLRGTRWNRSAFALSSFFAMALILVSLVPQTVNWLRDMLSLSGLEHGRLLALAILASFAAIVLALYTKARGDQLQCVLDRVICANAADGALNAENVDKYVKPIMILIPALNEARNFELLLPRIPREVEGIEVGVLVVDDGSSDGTGEVAKRYGCMVARNVMRRGQGAASRVGYLIAQRCGVDFAITMDADNQHRPEDLPAMLSPLLRGNADFVLGSRVLGSAQISHGIRSIGVTVLSRLITLLCGQRITDCSSGFKAFRMSAFSRLDLREEQFQNAEVIIEAVKKGLKVVEVPIHIAERSHGRSHKGTNVSYGLLFTKSMVKAWWR